VSDRHAIAIVVNGRRHEVTLESRRTLADALRHDLGYVGTNVGCEHGICGACTVLVDGEPARSCLLFAVQADGRSIETVEGLAEGDDLNKLQAAFSSHHGLQCGFCTPGFLMLATALLRAEPNPSKDRIREVMSSNLCRCTGYQGIIEAVEAATGE
jgi:aerobic-type carbon monoxide dehydrogenase small subunit (CoxS/CutS family)